MKILKLLALACAGIAVLIGAVAAYVAATFDPNAYKPQIIQLVKDKKQRTLKIDGDIKLKFWPSIGADLGKLSLSDFQRDTEFAAVDSARVALKLMPLLSKKVVVDEVEIIGARATLIKYKDGRMNVDDLLSKEEKKEQEAVAFDIAHVKIANSQLRYRDEALGAQYALSNVNLTTGRIAPNVPGKIDLSMTVQGDKPRLDLGVALNTRLTFDLDNQVFAFEGLGLETKGRALDMSNIDAKITGSKVDAKLKAGELTANGLALSLAALQGKTNRITVKGAGSLSAKLGAGELTTNGLSVALTYANGKDNLDLKLDAPKLLITRDKASGDKVTVAAKLTHPQGVTVANIVLPGIEGTAQAFRAAAMTLDLDMKQGDQTVKARVTSPLTGNIPAQQISLPQLAINVTASGPNLPGKTISGNLAGSASVNGSKQQVQANLSGKVSDSTIKAQVGVNGFAPPGITFDVDIDQLDVDKYASPAAGGAGAKGGAGAEKPLDLSALRLLRASGKLRIGTLKASNIRASNVRLEVKAGGGQVSVSPLSANLYGGAMNGALSVNAAQATPAFAIKQNLSGVSVGPLLKDLANKDMLDGKGTVNVDVRTQGATVGALKRALNGNAAVNLRDGAVKGIDIAGTINSAKAQLGSLTGKQTKQADNSKKTEFSELSGTFAIQSGVAHNNDLSLKSPLLRVGGAGSINIGEDSIDYLVKASIVGSLKGQGGRDANDLKGVTVPVRATGPLTAPSFALDFNAMLTDTVKQKAEDMVKSKIEERLFGKKPAPAAPGAAPAPNVRDAAKDALKGIFGR